MDATPYFSGLPAIPRLKNHSLNSEHQDHHAHFNYQWTFKLLGHKLQVVTDVIHVRNPVLVVTVIEGDADPSQTDKRPGRSIRIG